jgi:hypothetical protein
MQRLGGPEFVLIGIGLLITLFLYFLPSFIAFSKKKSNSGIIFLVNFLVGWSVIGWIVSLVWALSSDSVKTVILPNNQSNAQENFQNRRESDYDEKLRRLQKLKELFDSGALSSSEFEEQKSKILS